MPLGTAGVGLGRLTRRSLEGLVSIAPSEIGDQAAIETIHRIAKDPPNIFGEDIVKQSKRLKSGQTKGQKKSEKAAGARAKQKRRRLGRRASLVSSDDSNVRRKTLLGA